MKPEVFTKDMLVSGQHIVKTRCGEYNMVIGDSLVGSNSYIKLKTVTDGLKYDFREDLDIIKVYEMEEHFTLNELSSGECLTLLWQRESPEEAEKRIEREEKLKHIQTLEADIKKAQEALEETKKELEGE